MIKECIEKLVMMEDLSPEAMTSAMEEVMSGQATPAQVASFITALRMKGETVDEISCAARVMQGKAVRLNLPGMRLIDTCGTGGDGAMTFNISTAAALVVSAAGMPVAKHGNRAVSSRCGSADVLEALGVRVDLEPAQVEDCIRGVGIGFLFAPTFHLAMRHAAPTRREIGIRTIFNVLGPLTNPAGAPVQLMGVFSAGLAKKLAHALHHMGNRSAYVVHGAGGLDELSLLGPNLLYAVSGRGVEEFYLGASELGLNPAPVEELQGGTAPENAAIIRRLFEGASGPQRDVVLLNAGAAIAAASHQETGGEEVDIIEEIKNGIQKAAQAIDSGAARGKLRELASFTQSQPSKRQEMAS
ncbi:MAG: anthranilate phosphoribosyltransferase [Firmicutes bacterium]|nr:anthranilate phosphoribosyltransferase [Bacillota bacterium]